MPLAKTTAAIGAVTEVIQARLQEAATPLTVSVGRPEPKRSGGGGSGAHLNLFLYEVQFDGSLKNVPLDEGQPPPIWLVLKYLLTAFEDRDSDSINAHVNLGIGISALQSFALLPFASTDPKLDSLRDNPEDLKITFDEAPVDLLSKVMQGSDEKYRLSIAFQVRPVMIAAPETPSYSQLVGIDYTASSVTQIGESGIHTAALPSMGATASEVSPASFELSETVTITGTDLHLSNLSVKLGPVELPVTMQRPDQLQFVVRADLAKPEIISAGSMTISVTQLLPSGRHRGSNLLVGGLRPTLTAAGASAVNDNGSGLKFGTIDVTGKLLGKDDFDEFYLALFKDGKTVKFFDVLADTSAGAQTSRRCVMKIKDAVPPGKYLVIYRVNGQQAKQTFAVDLI